MINNDTAITIQGCKAEEVEYIDIFIPIVRYDGGNFWTSLGLYHTREEALEQLKNRSNIADAKILIHSEKFVYYPTA